MKQFSFELPNNDYIDQLASSTNKRQQFLDKQFTIFPEYPYMDQFYGLFSAYAPQIRFGLMMLPLNKTSDDGPTYVNAKQYHGIIRRRQSRAKAVLANKLIKRCKL
ncbi:hypothetical protein Ahy_A02g005726 [Arachis hypogaea]|uniref:Nuclear transcription factor Y subunit n=1 Tax=Arachis hypogaea TaxID=3818 RepID=A0A445E824_ARAHY|nr:hypothetical protein Ahy_A02g005726 [Arachis hypogaea]